MLWAGLRARLFGSGLAPGQRLGRRGERAAAAYLRRAGYRVLDRNVRNVIGEADLVCLGADGRTIVVVEVKTRLVREEDERGGPPPEANITAHKRRKLVGVARLIADQRGWRDRPLRIDVVAVEWPERGKPVIRHHENAVRG